MTLTARNEQRFADVSRITGKQNSNKSPLFLCILLGDTPVTVYWTMLYNSCILLIYSFCVSSHIVTKRSILFRVSTKATISLTECCRIMLSYNTECCRIMLYTFSHVRTGGGGVTPLQCLENSVSVGKPHNTLGIC